MTPPPTEKVNKFQSSDTRLIMTWCLRISFFQGAQTANCTRYEKRSLESTWNLKEPGTWKHNISMRLVTDSEITSQMISQDVISFQFFMPWWRSTNQIAHDTYVIKCMLIILGIYDEKEKKSAAKEWNYCFLLNCIHLALKTSIIATMFPGGLIVAST